MGHSMGIGRCHRNGHRGHEMHRDRGHKMESRSMGGIGR